MLPYALIAAATLNLVASTLVLVGARTNRRTTAIIQGILTQGEESWDGPDR